jgi:hypothetical protein
MKDGGRSSYEVRINAPLLFHSQSLESGERKITSPALRLCKGRQSIYLPALAYFCCILQFHWALSQEYYLHHSEREDNVNRLTSHTQHRNGIIAAYKR